MLNFQMAPQRQEGCAAQAPCKVVPHKVPHLVPDNLPAQPLHKAKVVRTRENVLLDIVDAFFVFWMIFWPFGDLTRWY